MPSAFSVRQKTKPKPKPQKQNPKISLTDYSGLMTATNSLPLFPHQGVGSISPPP